MGDGNALTQMRLHANLDYVTPKSSNASTPNVWVGICATSENWYVVKLNCIGIFLTSPFQRRPNPSVTWLDPKKAWKWRLGWREALCYMLQLYLYEHMLLCCENMHEPCLMKMLLQAHKYLYGVFLQYWYFWPIWCGTCSNSSTENGLSHILVFHNSSTVGAVLTLPVLRWSGTAVTLPQYPPPGLDWVPGNSCS